MENKQIVVDDYIVKCENEVITSILNDSESIPECIAILSPEDMISQPNRNLYNAIFDLHSEGKSITKNSLIDFVNANKKYQFYNWMNFIETAADAFFHYDDLKASLEIIKNASIKRQLDVFAKQVLDTKINFAQYNNQLFELEKSFSDIITSKRSNNLKNMAEVTEEYSKMLQRLYSEKKEITGTAIGFEEIDKLTNGFQPGDLIILAARPGIGKTALGLNFLLNAANNIKRNKKEHEEKVVMFSLEMGKEQLCQRLVSMDSYVEVNSLRGGNITGQEWDQVTDSLSKMSSLPILIDDSSDLSIMDIQTKCKQLRNLYKIKLVIVDYLQLLKGPRVKGAQANRQQEVATISRMLKLLARQIQAPVIAIAQLSRDIEKRVGDQRPLLSDLRESGAIEQDADLVTFIYKVKVEGEEENAAAQKQNINVPVQFIIAKHRNGSCGEVNLTMLRKYGKYVAIQHGDKNENK